MIYDQQVAQEVIEKIPALQNILVEIFTKMETKNYGEIIIKFEAGKITCVQDKKNVLYK